MPRQAADRRHGLELVDHVARDEIDVVVGQADAGVVDALATQLVQFGVIHPLHTLRQRRFVEVQLQPLDYMREITSMETHDVFGYTRRLRALSGPYSLQDPHGCCGLSLEALTDVIGVGPSPILKQHLSGLAGPGQRLQQVLHLVGGAFSFKWRLWYISYRYHLLSWSDPHYGTVVAL